MGGCLLAAAMSLFGPWSVGSVFLAFWVEDVLLSTIFLYVLIEEKYIPATVTSSRLTYLNVVLRFDPSKGHFV